VVRDPESVVSVVPRTQFSTLVWSAETSAAVPPLPREVCSLLPDGVASKLATDVKLVTVKDVSAAVAEELILVTIFREAATGLVLLAFQFAVELTLPFEVFSE